MTAKDIGSIPIVYPKVYKFPSSSMVEHSPDKRKTLDRNQPWEPLLLADSVTVITVDFDSTSSGSNPDRPAKQMGSKLVRN